MFAQTIRARTTDPDGVKALLQRWSAELAPAARGWLGTTAGVSADGRFFLLARFEDADAARANSARPDQDRFWSELSALFDGEAAFQDSSDVVVMTDREPDDAQFVQIIFGQSKDLARSNAMMAEHLPEMAAMRPDILGTVTVGHADGRYTSAVYFTSEGEARERERQQPPAEAQAAMQEMMALELVEPEFLDLTDPWLQSPARPT